MAPFPRRFDALFGDALVGDGGTSDPVQPGWRDGSPGDVYPDALSALPLAVGSMSDFGTLTSSVESDAGPAYGEVGLADGGFGPAGGGLGSAYGGIGPVGGGMGVPGSRFGLAGGSPAGGAGAAGGARPATPRPSTAGARTRVSGLSSPGPSRLATAQPWSRLPPPGQQFPGPAPRTAALPRAAGRAVRPTGRTVRTTGRACLHPTGRACLHPAGRGLRPAVESVGTSPSRNNGDPGWSSGRAGRYPASRRWCRVHAAHIFGRRPGPPTRVPAAEPRLRPGAGGCATGASYRPATGGPAHRRPAGCGHLLPSEHSAAGHTARNGPAGTGPRSPSRRPSRQRVGIRSLRVDFPAQHRPWREDRSRRHRVAATPMTFALTGCRR